MRLRCALVLLLFASRLGMPLMALAETGAPARDMAVAKSNEGDGSNAWLPRSVSIDDAARLTERRGERLPLDRWTSGHAARWSERRAVRWRHALHRRPCYPSRRTLHRRLARGVADSPPA